MIEFIAFSNMLSSFAEKESSGISDDDMQRISAVCDASPDCRFIATLGNTVDGNSDKTKSLSLLNNILNEYDREVSVHALMGKCDAVIPKRDFVKCAGYAMRYNAFDVSDYRCIFLDTCISDENDPYITDANCAFSVDEEQFNWLSRLLGRSHRPAVIFSHAPIAVSYKADEKYLLKGSDRVRELLESSKKVALVVSGCMNKSDCVVSRGVPYITLSPMRGNSEATFAKISVSSNGVDVNGFGAQESYSIAKLADATKKTLPEKLKAFFKKN